MANQSKQKTVQIVKDYSARLFGFIRGKVSSNEDAEDILQEVWFQLSQSVNVDEIEQISGWLFKVAKNKIIDRHRKKKPDSLDDYDPEEEGISFVKQILLTDFDDPETEYLREIFWKELFAALEELPRKQREVYIQNELEDKTLQQIADETDEKLKTIISRKGYAVKHLRKRLFTLYEEFFEYWYKNKTINKLNDDEKKKICMFFDCTLYHIRVGTDCDAVVECHIARLAPPELHLFLASAGIIDFMQNTLWRLPWI